MKILQVITSLWTGGAEKLVVQLTHALKERGHSVDVALFDGTKTDLKKELEKSGCRIFSFSQGGSMYSPRYIFKLRRLMKGYDMVHTHNSSPQLFAALANVFRKRPILVTTEHSTFNRRREKWYFRPLDKWMYGKYSATVCISRIAYDKLVSYLGKTTKIQIINNGADIAALSAAEPGRGIRKENEKHVVVMVAALREGKDQETLIRAVATMPEDYCLWLVGDGQRRSLLEALASQLKVVDRVRFFGWRTDIPAILKAADVVAMASHYEGLSLSSIEGMAVGKPFIASDVDGLREIVSGAGVLVPDSDSRAFAQKIQELCTDTEYAARVASLCGQRAAQFDFRNMVEAYDNLYRGLEQEWKRKNS